MGNNGDFCSGFGSSDSPHWRCGVTASFGVYLHEIKCDTITSLHGIHANILNIPIKEALRTNESHLSSKPMQR